MAKTSTTKSGGTTSSAKSEAGRTLASKGTGTSRAAAAKPKRAKSTTPRKLSANNALSKPLIPSAALAAVVGAAAIARSDVVSKMWEYIKKNNLQNPQNKREIMADAKLEPIFGEKKCSMFEMNKHLSRHLSNS